jgi:hypothetical protein
MAVRSKTGTGAVQRQPGNLVRTCQRVKNSDLASAQVAPKVAPSL